MRISENSMKVLNYLKEHNGSTAAEVAKAIDMQKRLVDSYFSAGIVKNELGYRDREVTPSKLYLNEAGMNYTQEEE